MCLVIDRRLGQVRLGLGGFQPRWMLQHDEGSWCFINHQNRGSVALHQRLDFNPVAQPGQLPRPQPRRRLRRLLPRPDRPAARPDQTHRYPSRIMQKRVSILVPLTAICRARHKMLGPGSVRTTTACGRSPPRVRRQDHHRKNPRILYRTRCVSTPDCACGDRRRLQIRLAVRPV
jgi:hypothetical protein